MLRVSSLDERMGTIAAEKARERLSAIGTVKKCVNMASSLLAHVGAYRVPEAIFRYLPPVSAVIPRLWTSAVDSIDVVRSGLDHFSVVCRDSK